MPIEIACPECRRPLRVPDHLLGEQVKCPGCEHAFIAVADKTPSAPTPPAPPRSSPDEAYQARAEDRPRVPLRPSGDNLDEDDDYNDHPRRRHYVPHRGTLILILGIVSFFLAQMMCLGFATGLPAWFMGTADIKQMRAGVMDPSGESITNAGRWLGLVFSILNLIGCFGLIIWVVVAVALDS